MDQCIIPIPASHSDQGTSVLTLLTARLTFVCSSLSKALPQLNRFLENVSSQIFSGSCGHWRMQQSSWCAVALVLLISAQQWTYSTRIQLVLTLGFCGSRRRHLSGREWHIPGWFCQWTFRAEPYEDNLSPAMMLQALEHVHQPVPSPPWLQAHSRRWVAFQVLLPISSKWLYSHFEVFPAYRYIGRMQWTWRL